MQHHAMIKIGVQDRFVVIAVVGSFDLITARINFADANAVVAIDGQGLVVAIEVRLFDQIAALVIGRGRAVKPVLAQDWLAVGSEERAGNRFSMRAS